MSNEGSLRRRGMIAAAIGFCVFAVVLASAASLTVNSGDLGAGTDLVASCDTDGVTTSIATTYTSGTGYTVTSVTVGGIANACDGMAISATLTDGSETALGSGSGTVSGTSKVLAVSGSPLASAVTKTHVVIG